MSSKLRRAGAAADNTAASASWLPAKENPATRRGFFVSFIPAPRIKAKGQMTKNPWKEAFLSLSRVF
jgi:hypothetical protein